MKETRPRVITIPAKPEIAQQHAVQRQLRVAAYCRVSTDEEEQLTSYAAQQTYYTDKIMANKNWTLAGIFADEGITGTSARKRPEFLRMIRLCKQKKIDIILTKSISRFARNTVDCLNYIRALRELGIAVIFEKEYIETALYLILTPNTGLLFVYFSIYCGFVGASEPAHCGLSLICRLNLQPDTKR